MPVQKRGKLPAWDVWLLQRIRGYAGGAGAEAPVALVYDACDHASDARRAEGVATWVFGHPPTEEWVRYVLATPMFEDSALMPGTQIVDYCVSVIRQYWEHHDGKGRAVGHEYRAAVQRLRSLILTRVRDVEWPKGNRLYGEYRLSQEVMQRAMGAGEPAV